MRIIVFSTKSYDRDFLEAANKDADAGHQLEFQEPRLGAETAALATGAVAVCAFVNDRIDRTTLTALAGGGTRLVALRCAGFNNVDLNAAKELGISVGRVPAYSPQAVAEHTVGLVLSLNRKIHKAYSRVREGNFALEGLLGFDLSGCTVGIIGTGKIGMAVARILSGFGCRLLAFDPVPGSRFEAQGGSYVEFVDLLTESDLITLHCPLTPETRHLIDDQAIGLMKRGVMLINTSRGAMIDTRAVITGLKAGQIGYLGLDVYEEEADLFFENLSDQVIRDDIFARLLTFPNVLITGHQAFFTRDAMTAIARTTIENITTFEQTGSPAYPVSVERITG